MTRAATTNPSGTRSFWIIGNVRDDSLGCARLQALPARVVNLIHSDVLHALPVFKRALVALVTRPAGQSTLHHDVFAPEWAVAIATRRSEDGDDRRSRGGRELHR